MRIYAYFLLLFIWLSLAASSRLSSSSRAVSGRTRNANETQAAIRRLRRINRHHRRRQGGRRRQNRRRHRGRNQAVTPPGEDGRELPISTVAPTLNAQIWRRRVRNREARIFMIQRQILKQLGFDHQPNVTRPHLTEEQIKQMMEYNKNRTKELHNLGSEHHGTEKFFSSTIRNPRASCERPPRWDDRWSSTESFRLYFDLKSVPDAKSTRVATAFLKIMKKSIKDSNCSNCELASSPSPQPRSGSARRQRSVSVEAEVESDETDADHLRITAFQYLKPRRNRLRKKLLDSVMVPKNYQGAIKLNLLSAASEWMRRPNKNFGVGIFVEDSLQRELNPNTVLEGTNCSQDNDGRPVTTPSTVALGNNSNVTMVLDIDNSQPSLLLTTEVPISATSRTKRMIRKPVQEPCLGHRLHIDFQEIGWNDWVLAPRGIDTLYCNGECPGLDLDANYMLPTMSCCSPTETESMSMIYLDTYKRVVLAKLENIIVTKCGCRT